jgi:hypothetical protein
MRRRLWQGNRLVVGGDNHVRDALRGTALLRREAQERRSVLPREQVRARVIMYTCTVYTW